MKSSVLPESFLKCLSAKDRRSLGQMTSEEALRKCQIKSERDLQKTVVGLLRLRGIEPIVSRFGKKTTNNVGTPDILFAIEWGAPYDRGEATACAFEIKLPGCKPSSEQTKMHERLTRSPNCWDVRIIESVDQAIAALKEIGMSPAADNLSASLTS